MNMDIEIDSYNDKMIVRVAGKTIVGKIVNATPSGTSVKVSGPVTEGAEYIQKMKKSKDKTIVIVVYRGLVSEVKNVPPGWDYIINDLDVQEEEMSQEEWDKLKEGEAIPPHRD